MRLSMSSVYTKVACGHISYNHYYLFISLLSYKIIYLFVIPRLLVTLELDHINYNHYYLSVSLSSRFTFHITTKKTLILALLNFYKIMLTNHQNMNSIDTFIITINSLQGLMLGGREK